MMVFVYRPCREWVIIRLSVVILLSLAPQRGEILLRQASINYDS